MSTTLCIKPSSGRGVPLVIGCCPWPALQTDWGSRLSSCYKALQLFPVSRTWIRPFADELFIFFILMDIELESIAVSFCALWIHNICTSQKKRRCKVFFLHVFVCLFLMLLLDIWISPWGLIKYHHHSRTLVVLRLFSSNIYFINYYYYYYWKTYNIKTIRTIVTTTYLNWLCVWKTRSLLFHCSCPSVATRGRNVPIHKSHANHLNLQVKLHYATEYQETYFSIDLKKTIGY